VAAQDPNKIPDTTTAPGVYVHVPFCGSICSYCNFNRGLYDEALKTRFVAALIKEIRSGASGEGQGVTGEGQWANAPDPLPLAPDTLYFGGGTPSLLSPDEVASIIDACREFLQLSVDPEITLEANPETVTPRLLEHFRAAGVNRLSFGVQSFRDDELQRLGRRHSGDRAAQVVDMARAAGFDNISLDLMMWLPGQRVSEWRSNVEKAIDVAPDHLSLYILEVYPHLPLKQEIDRRGWVQESDEGVAEMYESAMGLVDDAGFRQYEISNVCQPGRESRHNLKYWIDGNWLGFGPGAHSTWRGSRWRNISPTLEYVERVTTGAPVIAERRVLDKDERLGDALFTGLRLSQGIDLDELSRRYDTDIWGRFESRLLPFLDAGLLLRQDGRLKLTRQGMLVANEVMSVFV
jgi:oxygen-independent coproporphyrinogen-3 oxidase